MSDFKWGTWYPIETRPKARVARKRDLFWIPDWGGFDNATRAPRNATHWMPDPPSPEEMAAKPSLEAVLRKRIAWLETPPESFFGEDGTERILGSGAWWIPDRIKELRALLKEAGLE